MNRRHGRSSLRARLGTLAAVATLALGGCALDGRMPTDEPSSQPATETRSLVFQDGVAPGTSYASTRDAYISEAAPTTSFGRAATLVADGWDSASGGKDLASLLRWDLSAIPASSTVTSVTLELTSSNASPESYPVYEVLRDWDEASVTWRSARTGVAWTAPGLAAGSDRASNAVGAIGATAIGRTTLLFGTGSAGLALVQRWVRDPASNRGLYIGSASNGDSVVFASREAATAASRPRLLVTFATSVSTDAGTDAARTDATTDATRADTAAPGTDSGTVGSTDAASGTGATTWRQVALGGGGFVTGVFVHPNAPDVLYLRTDVGGALRLDPATQRWIPLTDGYGLADKATPNIEGLALDPADSNVVYIATGRFTTSAGRTFKSTNRGASWTQLPLNVGMAGNDDQRWAGERLVVSPHDSRRVFFGSRTAGLWRSLDAGASWARVTSLAPTGAANIGILAVAFDPTNAQVMYANVYGDGVYRSADAGASWARMAGGPTNAERLTVARDGTLWATARATAGVWKRAASGSWTSVTPASIATGYAAIAVDPANANHVVVAQAEQWQTKLYRTTDGGASWTQKTITRNSTVPWWPSTYFANWAASLAFDPHHPGRVWLTDWFGTWRTNDIAAQPAVWTSVEAGHEQVVTLTLAAPLAGPVLLSGVADVDGFAHEDLAVYPTRQLADHHDTYGIAFCETQPTRVVRVGGNRSSGPYGGGVSNDYGRTFTPFASFPAGVQPTRVAVSATAPDQFVVLASGGQAIRTSNRGASWTTVTGLPNGPLGPWATSIEIAADKVDGRYYYYDAPRGRLLRSTDGGASFVQVNGTLPVVPDVYTNHAVKTVPGRAGEVWVSADRAGLFRSIDGGTSFTRVANVERAFLFAIGATMPGATRPAVFVMGNANGQGENFYRSDDGGASWRAIGDARFRLGSASTMEASRRVPGQVFVGTGGRGIFVGQPSSP